MNIDWCDTTVTSSFGCVLPIAV